MAMTNHERVGKALDLLRQGLAPFVDREFNTALKNHHLTGDFSKYVQDPMLIKRPVSEWDISALLKLMWDLWNNVFKRTLGHAERSLVSELRQIRNNWAHQQTFSSDDAYRALDSVGRLLTAISAPQVEEVEKLKNELLRLRFDEQVRSEKRKAGGSLVQAAASGALKPWREVVTPHPDVASGRYQQAEFAADLWQVHLGEGTDEYKDPVEFFRRTYLTESLQQLLVNAVQRLSGNGGDPVVQLQTNFGGGKTHSMLALYHLFSGVKPAELPGVEALLAEAEINEVPKANRVVLVGNRISPGNPVTKPDGTVVRTLWGELVWQLGGAEAYARIQADDENATCPGDVLRELLIEYGPCLILIDEWVAYARQLHDLSDLPGGSFETQFTFAQALTESAKLAGNCLLVISLPASDTAGSPHTQSEDVEVGGLRGREALDRLRNVVGRLESSWRPASAEEGFEIVRRRLFQPLADQEAFKQRDVTARAFADLYRQNKSEFPLECGSADYEKRLKAAYPIHPEIFDRLYSDWSTLIKFQRTRGVLRLMAAVIHSLWEKGDKNPLILPSTIPMDDTRVRFELTRYLSDNWAPVIDKDLDGPASLPLAIDNEVPNLGKIHACRRVARTIYLGSAPIQTAAHQGIEDRRIRLGCVMPGESIPIFGDALRRLAEKATYLYQDGPRYWYSTQPTVGKLAEDRAEQLKRDADKVIQELEKRLRQDLTERGDFIRIHPLPKSSADVSDEPVARLVVLGPEQPYARDKDNPAIAAAKTLLEYRGNSPRIYRNSLVFLAADKSRLPDLDQAIRHFLAWESILNEKDTLDLSPHQVKQAQTQLQSADTTVTARIPETYQWLLVPIQNSPQEPVHFQPFPLRGQDKLALRASKKLRSEDLLIRNFGPTLLRMEMDRIPLWRGNHVEIRQLLEHFARYIYLPRMQSPAVLINAISEGVALLTWRVDTFAYADSFDETAGRYRGLRGGFSINLTGDDPPGLLVKPEVADAQLKAETSPSVTKSETGESETGEPGIPETSVTGAETPPTLQPPRRFHGSVLLDPTRVGLHASKIADEVIAHLSGLVGAKVTVTLEIEAEVPNGVPEQVVRTVTENSRTLKFKSQGFEME
ncbi:MAG: Swt1 family HEPN domain-containing protein [Calditrichia bacterium]